jgi:hypothetical protein
MKNRTPVERNAERELVVRRAFNGLARHLGCERGTVMKSPVSRSAAGLFTAGI